MVNTFSLSIIDCIRRLEVGLFCLTQKRYESNEKTGKQHVENIEHGTPPQVYVVCDIRIRLLTTRVIFYISLHVHVHQLKLAIIKINCIIKSLQSGMRERELCSTIKLLSWVDEINCWLSTQRPRLS